MFRLIAAAVPNVTPKATLPGTNVLQSIGDGLAAAVLTLCVIGALVSAGMLGMGHLSSNQRVTDRAKQGLLGSIFGAVLVGGVTVLVNWAFSTGGKIH